MGGADAGRRLAAGTQLKRANGDLAGMATHLTSGPVAPNI